MMNTIGMLNAGRSAAVVWWHFGCTQKTIERLWRRFQVAGNAADHPRSGRPLLTTAADDHYIILQHLPNRRLTAAASGRQYGIHPQTVRKNLKAICAYRPYFSQSHRMARRDKCYRHMHF